MTDAWSSKKSAAQRASEALSVQDHPHFLGDPERPEHDYLHSEEEDRPIVVDGGPDDDYGVDKTPFVPFVLKGDYPEI